MKKEDDKKFQTHIKEPRWQQIASIALAVILALVWLFLATRH